MVKRHKPPLVPAAAPVAPAEIPSEPHPAAHPEDHFPIVGIGASAGGLKAFEAFFSAMPADTKSGMAFVLVQHLAPDHKSILCELVKRFTRMQVFEVEEGMTVRPHCAYIIPPNRDIALLNGSLHLLEPSSPRGLRLPINFFFRSLAEDQHERAIGIVLSGTGSDGALGVRWIKGEGGMVMAQNPESTEFDGMPSAAIATGLVDFVLPPAKMPARLISYVAHAFRNILLPISSPVVPPADDSLHKIFLLLRSLTGHDFSGYKQSTISRRVERRMAVHQIERREEYIRYLQQNRAEAEALFHDFLIRVTSFFRDPEAYAALEAQVISRLLADKSAGEGIRVWAAGCSTGEEAYSIAILLRERMEALKRSFRIQVFATDIDRRAIELARAGIYPGSIAADVTPERLARFFTPEPDGGHYRVVKVIRDMLIFSEQNVIRDPPFSKLDLIVCRNLLIYLKADLQKKLLSLFHYALNLDGALFLGTSETVGEFVNLFGAIDHKAKLFRHKEDGSRALKPARGIKLRPVPEDQVPPRLSGSPPGNKKAQLRELTERALLEHYAPVGALVDKQGEILFLQGRTGPYLELAPGEASMNILKMAREGLRQELTTVLRKASLLKGPIRRPRIRIKTNGKFCQVDLTVWPVAGSSDEPSEANRFLVVLEETPVSDEAKAAVLDSVKGADADGRVVALKQELRAKEESLHAMNEVLESANEELYASNEEMQSINEELQSTNEELETSKEELQSTNEELATVNAELRQKVTDLSLISNDISNLMVSTGMGIIFVDLQQIIRRFTPAVTQVINLIPTDLGRPMGHIVSNLKSYDRLEADVQAVLDSLTPREIEVQTHSGAWYLLQIRPYRSLENVIDGAVITFTEMTEMKQAQAVLQESEVLRRLAIVVRDAHAAITVQDLAGRILVWNPGAVRIFGWSEAEALTMNIRDMQPEPRREEERSRARHLSQSKIPESYCSQRITKVGGILEVLLISTALVDQAGDVYALATTAWDIDANAGQIPDHGQRGKA
jgi:two-component system CheB/CheR fusion protein